MGRKRRSFHVRYTASVKCRYRFRVYPTIAQEESLKQTFGACRFVYNRALRMRTDAFQRGEKMNYGQSSAEFTKARNSAEFPWLREVPFVPCQQSLRHLQTAFRNFFEKRAKYPSFRRRDGKQSAEYTSKAFQWDGKAKRLSCSGVGVLDVRWSRSFGSAPTTVTITKSPAGRYFVTLCLDEQFQALPETNAAVGIDLGINRLATLSTGERISNPKHLNRYQRRMGRLQRTMARRKKGSGRRVRCRIAIARLHERIADTRKDHLDKVTTSIVRRFSTIAIEDLNVRGMVANHCLARSISDAGFGMFRRMLEYKCERHGRKFVAVDRFFPSSKRCFGCGHIVEKLPLSVREWTCPECGSVHDRDENAAKNILAAGHAVTARGGPVRPKRTAVRLGTGRRTVNRSEISA